MGQMAEGRQRMNGSACGTLTNKQGFGLIELIFVIAIIALMAMVAVPNVQNFLARYNRQQFLGRFDSLVTAGYQRAVRQGTIHKVLIDLAQHTISLWGATGKKDAQSNDVFAPATESPLTHPCIIPENVTFKQCFIEGFDEIGRFEGNRAAARVWFYMMPDGTTQSVIINMIFNRGKGQSKEIGMILNPFSGRFKVYDAFQKP